MYSMPGKINPFIQNILVELQSRFSELYGGRLIQLILYGSQARGEAGSGSDIYILVVFRGAVDAGLEIARTGEIVAALSLDHDVAIACVFMEEDRYLHRQGPFLRNVRREGIVFEELLAESKGAWTAANPPLWILHKLRHGDEEGFLKSKRVTTRPKWILTHSN